MKDIYERNINLAVARKNDREICTKATMLDLNHHIRVELTIALQTERIINSESQMTKVPYGVCQFALHNIKSIEGLKIERGINKKLSDKLGRADGCTHMVDLAMEAVRLSANVMMGLNKVGDEWFDRGLRTEEEMIARVKPYLKNTCLPFKEEEREAN